MYIPSDREVLERLDEIESDSAERRALALLEHLGFTPELLARPLAALSGGWRVRTMLAAAIFARCVGPAGREVALARPSRGRAIERRAAPPCDRDATGPCSGTTAASPQRTSWGGRGTGGGRRSSRASGRGGGAVSAGMAALRSPPSDPQRDAAIHHRAHRGRTNGRGSPDLLLLDEPTNHLSILAVLWLARELSTGEAWKERIIVTVSHDRAFVDEVCGDVLHISGVARRLTQSRGNYSLWAAQRKELQLTYEREKQQRQVEIDRLREFAGHGFRYGGSSSAINMMQMKVVVGQ